MKLFHTETNALPPSPAVVHHHAPSPWAEIFARVSGGVFMAFALWFGLMFVLKKAGISHPDEFLASMVLWLFGIAVAGIGFNHLLNRWLTHREAMADKRTEQLRYRQLMQQSVVTDSRRTGTDARLAALVIAIMQTAFDYHARNGSFRGQWRPWSRRAAAEIIPINETQPVGEAMARKARAFMEKHEIIIDGQLNLRRYPDMASIQRLLYDPPVVVIGDNQHLRLVK